MQNLLLASQRARPCLFITIFSIIDSKFNSPVLPTSLHIFQFLRSITTDNRDSGHRIKITKNTKTRKMYPELARSKLSHSAILKHNGRILDEVAIKIHCNCERRKRREFRAKLYKVRRFGTEPVIDSRRFYFAKHPSDPFSVSTRGNARTASNSRVKFVRTRRDARRPVSRAATIMYSACLVSDKEISFNYVGCSKSRYRADARSELTAESGS